MEESKRENARPWAAIILHIQRGIAALRRVTGFNLKQAFSLGDQVGDIGRVFGIVFAPAPVQYLAPLGSDNANKLILRNKDIKYSPL